VQPLRGLFMPAVCGNGASNRTATQDCKFTREISESFAKARVKIRDNAEGYAPCAMRVLVVEDDVILGEGVTRYLRQAGYGVELAANGAYADTLLAHGDYDVVVLDIGLPGLDGYEVLRRLRARDCRAAVLILTARDAVEERVRGLDLGADDYMVKPFALVELEARVRAVVRRHQAAASAQVAYGPLVLDLGARRAWLEGELLRLTAREWNLLEFLVLRAGKMVNKDQIAAAMTRDEGEVSHTSIEVHVSRLRSKLDHTGIRIRSIRGFGYYLERPHEARP
jgi:two-component system OmpR family response regulator